MMVVVVVVVMVMAMANRQTNKRTNLFSLRAAYLLSFEQAVLACHGAARLHLLLQPPQRDMLELTLDVAGWQCRNELRDLRQVRVGLARLLVREPAGTAGDLHGRQAVCRPSTYWWW